MPNSGPVTYIRIRINYPQPVVESVLVGIVVRKDMLPWTYSRLKLRFFGLNATDVGIKLFLFNRVAVLGDYLVSFQRFGARANDIDIS